MSTTMMPSQSRMRISGSWKPSIRRRKMSSSQESGAENAGWVFSVGSGGCVAHSASRPQSLKGLTTARFVGVVCSRWVSILHSFLGFCSFFQRPSLPLARKFLHSPSVSFSAAVIPDMGVGPPNVSCFRSLHILHIHIGYLYCQRFYRCSGVLLLKPV